MDPQKLTSLCSESQQTQMCIYTGVFFAISVLALGLRLYSKSRFSRGITADDYLAIASMVSMFMGWNFVLYSLSSFADGHVAAKASSVAGVVAVVLWAKAGLGLHIACVRLDRAVSTLKWSLACQIISDIGICLIKISIILRVLQVLDRVSRRLRIFLWILAAFIILAHLSELILLCLSCRPMRALWDWRVKGKCLSHGQLYAATYAHIGLDAFTDLICAWIPVVIIMRLRLRTGAKVGICILMALGSIVAGCAIAKAVVLPSFWNADFTWQSIAPAQWAVAEQSLCIILASVPASKPLFDKAVRAASSIRTHVEQTSKSPGSNTHVRRKAMKHVPLSSIMITTDIRSSQRFETDVVSKGSPRATTSFSSWVEPGQAGEYQRQMDAHGAIARLDTNKPLPCLPIIEPRVGTVYGDKVKVSAGDRFEYVMMGRTPPWPRKG